MSIGGIVRCVIGHMATSISEKNIGFVVRPIACGGGSGIGLFSIPPMTDEEYAAQQERAKVVETYTPISLKETWSPPKQVADALLQAPNKEGGGDE
jgi:hypothetical protein